MKLGTRLAALTGAVVAPLLVVALPAPTAGAHGYVSSPPSRQAQCAAGVVDCGQIQWEPQSVEGPKGLRSCSGGNAQFAELDDDGKGWQVTPVGSTTTFTWHLTARHATSNWQYFAGGRLVAQFDDGGARPGATVTHRVDFGGLTGQQKVLAVWNIADTGNAFYACTDVRIGGGDSGGGDSGGGDGTACLPAGWDAGTVYTGGDTVTWGGHNWRAKWWTRGEEPGTTGQWGVWEDLGACADG
ncbi:lytic polysaccharide monooxygenase [Streptomyces aidingensis]|uniref:Chitin-binding protein n=1 Tax=Streptomyces aidingensis TaxID=910347 RepID=A0A1I1TF44_9ACTN|nr:lytic polysaccharide monooxygenase [Streptomyces aidingensis]SFD54100.1 chitin-binding protein [Streptomyces aidingensis]